MHDVIKRLAPFLCCRVLPRVFVGETVCIISHSNTLVAACHIIGVDAFRLKNAQAVSYSYDGASAKFLKTPRAHEKENDDENAADCDNP